jgi:hypothetical protein
MVKLRMRRIAGLMLAVALAAPCVASGKADFSGKWVFNASRSKNVGMMSKLQLVSSIAQTRTALTVSDASNFDGNAQTRETHYDLTGKSVPNESFMGEKCQTVTKWTGDKLLTLWTSEGAVAGSKTVRTETRYLSADGKTMTLESARGTNPPVVMLFDKQ